MNTPARRRAGVAAACAALAAVSLAQAPANAVSTPTVTTAVASVSRLAGADRYDTSARISAANFAPGVPVAYVAKGTDFPDALSGASAGATGRGPVLLVQPTAIPTVIASELTRLRPQRIVVLGGAGSVSAGVATALGQYTSGSVTRLAGADRYSTSARISAATFAPGVAVAYVAKGTDFPDALSGGTLGGPVLLVRPTAIPTVTASELTRLRPQRIVVLGGTGSVSTGVATALGQYTSGSVTRLAGADRYSTSARISAATFAPGVDVAYVAKGTDFPDALSGGPLGGIQHAPVLLVRPTSIPTAVATELARLKPQRIVVLGGTGSISGSVATQLGSQSATPPAPSVTTKPASTQLVFGGVGDVATMSSTSGERVAHHVYGHLQDKYIPVGEMVTINAHTAPWTSVANAQPGSALYADMVRWARAIGGRSGTVLVAFGHEPEQAAKKNLGTPAEYKAAYQKVVAVFRSSGVRNVKWVFQATDWGFRTDSTAYNYAPRFYPGDAYVDIIGADAYNWHTCGHGQGRDVPLSTLAAPMVTFAKQHGKLASLPEFAANSTVDRAAWIKNGYTWLQSNREMFVAAFYFNHPPTNPANQDCQWPLSRSSEYREVSAVVADGWTTP